MSDRMKKNPLVLVAAEMYRQIELWGDQCGKPQGIWSAILTEEVGEVAKAVLDNDVENLKEELIQVAAVAASWYNCLTREQSDG